MKLQTGDRLYELELGMIEKILPNPCVVPVPRAPEQVVGLLYYQGNPIPVFLPEPGASCGRTGRLAVLLRVAGKGLRAVLADQLIGEDGTEEDCVGTIHR